MFNKPRHKNSLQNSDKPYSTTHQKDNISWTSHFHSRDARVAQHMWIYKCTTVFKQKQGQKSHDHLNRCIKSLWQNSSLFPDKSTEETRNKRNVPQYNKIYMWQTNNNYLKCYKIHEWKLSELHLPLPTLRSN
jgi:hypothetical protein